ncbi:MAG TPA: 5'-3' exonuclease [Candidatus Dormibacteraeota bacterium]|nr:5'-3' exonuclease [Candidatus Dormibacteraeota bacterium]
MTVAVPGMTGPVRPRLLLDSPSLIYRAFFALPPTIRAPTGRSVNAVRGYLDMCSRLLVDRRPSGMVHVLDADWRPAFRVAAYAGYKENRRPDPPELPPQFELLDEILDAAGVERAEAPGVEADDVLGTLATRATADAPVEIVSGDRDLLQLVRDPAVAVLFTVRGVSGLDRYDEAAVRTRYGVPPAAYADMAILRGDASDDLPGVAGIGAKTAAALIAEHGSLAELRRRVAVSRPQGVTPRIATALRDAASYLDAMTVVVPVRCDLELTETGRRDPDVARLREIGEREAVDGPVERLLEALAGLRP